MNPAYTLVIGRVKFAKRYGLSVHHAAALVIAGRQLSFSERLPSSLGNIPDGHDSHVTFPGLVKIRGEHVWKSWAKVSKMLKTALAAQYQKRRQVCECRSDLTGPRLEEFGCLSF